jgi:hypothetical protein
VRCWDDAVDVDVVFFCNHHYVNKSTTDYS